MASLLLNIGNFITLKLSPTNYPLRREQALALVESQELLDHLTIENSAPPTYPIPESNTTSAKTSTQKMIDAYITCRKVDRFLQGWLIGTLFEETLGIVMGLNIAHVV